MSLSSVAQTILSVKEPWFPPREEEVTEKRCKECKRVKPLEAFRRVLRPGDGKRGSYYYHRGECLLCDRKRSRENMRKYVRRNGRWIRKGKS
jgi:hypothetical protein